MKKQIEFPTTICRDCLDGINQKALLNCGHNVCAYCLDRFVAVYFENELPYEYSDYCSTCKTKERLGMNYWIKLESISLECGCNWNIIGTKIEDFMKFDGKLFND